MTDEEPRKASAGFLQGLLVNQQSQQTLAPKRTLADILFKRGRGITMRSRLTPKQIQAIFIARTMADLYGDTHLFDATTLLMELPVSLNGEGRKEGVELGKAVYQTSIGAQTQSGSPDKDPSLDG